MSAESLTAAQLDSSLVWIASYPLAVLVIAVVVYLVYRQNQLVRRIAVAIGSALIAIPLAITAVGLPQEALGLPFWLALILASATALVAFFYVIASLRQ